jgi:hypothetical protein
MHGKQDLCRAFFFAFRPIKTHDKKAFCRALKIKCTAKISMYGKCGFSRGASETRRLVGICLFLAPLIQAAENATGQGRSGGVLFHGKPPHVIMRLRIL